MSVLDMLENYRAQAENMRKHLTQAKANKHRTSDDRERIASLERLLGTLEYAIREMEKSESRNVRFRHRSDIRLDGRRQGHG